MVEENKRSDSLYDNLAEIRPARNNAPVVGELLPPEGGAGSVTSRMQLSPKKSDFQLADSRLFPILRETLEWLRNLMVARVFPDTMNPLRNIIIKHLLQTYDDIEFAEAVVIAEVAVTAALDSGGRIEIVQMFIKGGEESEEKKEKGL